MNNLIESLLATFQSKDSHSYFPLVYSFMLFCFSCGLSTILRMKGGEESFIDNSNKRVGGFEYSKPKFLTVSLKNGGEN